MRRLGSHLNSELVDHDQADCHGDIGQQGEDGQGSEVPDEHQQHHEWQEHKHVESRVHSGCQDHRLVVVAVAGGPIGRFYHLEWRGETEKASLMTNASDPPTGRGSRLKVRCVNKVI